MSISQFGELELLQTMDLVELNNEDANGKKFQFFKNVCFDPRAITVIAVIAYFVIK